METINLLELLNKHKDIYTLDFASCDHDLVNFLDLITEDEQFTQKINLGIVYIASKTLNQVLLVDGLSRVLSLSLLLHAVCECYKKTTPKNEIAIKTIRQKYLIDGDKTKLHLPKQYQEIYNKIIFGEKLSGKEKDTPMFALLHNFWTQIKEEHLLAANIFKMLQKVYVAVINVSEVSNRDLYYTLNRNKREINQFALIKDYLNEYDLEKEWGSLSNIFNNNLSDLDLFFKDFFATKMKFKVYNNKRLYELFVNYFLTMLQYMNKEVLFNKLLKTARLYSDLLNVNFEDDAIKRAIIKLKMNNGEDTYAYILCIYEDYIDGNITHATFIEILNTINEYIQKRLNTPNNVTFNELINYLNAFITCK